MDDLLTSTINFHDRVKRNIVFLSKPETAFASLLDDTDDVGVVTDVTTQARLKLSRTQSINDFCYTAAIEYPFKTEPFMHSRYSNGTFGIWYGSLAIDTTIYETIYHSIKFLTATEGFENETEIIRKRSVFEVNCSGLFIQLLGKEIAHPELVADDYTFTHSLGSMIRATGMPGIMSPSARQKKGVNINVFKHDALSQPNKLGDLVYRIQPQTHTIQVEGCDVNMSLNF